MKTLIKVEDNENEKANDDEAPVSFMSLLKPLIPTKKIVVGVVNRYSQLTAASGNSSTRL